MTMKSTTKSTVAATGKALPRRTVLRGLGVALGLPMLDAMVPAFSAVAKAAAKPVHRFQAIYVPNGMAMDYWTPATEGRGFELTPILSSLAPYREQLTVLSGLRSSWGYVHAGASGSFLTGTARGGRSETEVLASTSIDQLLAREFGTATQLGSLEVSMDKFASAGHPRAVFERLFGDSGSAAPAARLARVRQTKSLLDSVNEKLADINRSLGAGDRAKVTEYTDAVRDVERRIQLAEQQSRVEPTLVDEPHGPPQEFEAYLDLMLDLQVLALQSDLTRVVTFMMGREQSTRTYPQVGVSDAHHPLSHHDNVPERVEQMSKINRYHVKLTADYLAKLRATPDGDGSLLDHMTILYGAGLSNSTRHQSTNLPLLLLGGGAGTWKGGKHLRFSEDTTNANLLVTLMDKLGVPVEKLGNSTGRVDIDPLSI